jgi:hypothetical protein
MLTGFSNVSTSNGFPANEPIAVHKGRTLAPGTPFQFRCAAAALHPRPLCSGSPNPHMY